VHKVKGVIPALDTCVIDVLVVTYFFFSLLHNVTLTPHAAVLSFIGNRQEAVPLMDGVQCASGVRRACR
jgi:hypothetical protein